MKPPTQTESASDSPSNKGRATVAQRYALFFDPGVENNSPGP